MKVFLIILAVFAVIIALILSLSAEINAVFDEKWTFKVRIAFIEREVSLTKVLNFILFPEKAAVDAVQDSAKNKNEAQRNGDSDSMENEIVDEIPGDRNVNTTPEKKASPNFIKKIYDQDGIVGIMLLISNLIETVNSAGLTLFKGLHIYSLYVKIIVAGRDAADCARSYGKICGLYNVIKGVILNGMKVDQYDDYIQPDFIAPKSEYGFQLIASINVALLLKVLLKAGKVFVVNLIKNK